jgi:dipeptidyl aminopeptidase/acylaminoacyl peptidase
VKPSDIGRIVSVASPALSPGATHVAFVVTRVDMDDNRYRSQVWLARTDGAEAPRPLTAGERSDGNPTWSPDGRELAFTSRRAEKKGDATLHVIPIHGPGEVRTLATLPEGIDGLAWSPDGRWIAFGARTRDARYDKDEESWQPPRRITRFFAQIDDEGWTFDRPHHVYVVPVDGSAKARNLTPGEFQFGGAAWLADSSGLVCSGAAHDTWDLDFAEDLYVVQLANGKRRALTKQTGSYGQPRPAPGGTAIGFLGADDPSTYPQNVHVGVIDASGGAHRWLSRGLDRSFAPTSGAQPPIWLGEADGVAGDGEGMLALAEDRGRVSLYRVAVDGDTPPELVIGGDRWISGFDAGRGVIAFVAGTADEPDELFVRFPNGEERQLTTLTQAMRDAVHPLPYERFTAPSTDGVEVDAWIVRPPNFEETQRYPVLLSVHGGPFGQYGEHFFDEAQLYASAGYVVLLSNPRGSSGREDAWGQAILGAEHPRRRGTGWGSVDVDDVLAVLDEALRRYTFCDASRVGMLGGSYGGYMATWLAAHHGERFRAICSERAVNNLVSEEWSSDIATIFRVTHGPSHLDAPEEYARMSPVTYVDKIDTPMLLIHSEQDLRCPIAQAEELFVALRLRGKDVEFVRFPGEGHELSRSGSPVHRVQRAEIILEFFGKHLAEPAENAGDGVSDERDPAS